MDEYKEPEQMPENQTPSGNEPNVNQPPQDSSGQPQNQPNYDWQQNSPSNSWQQNPQQQNSWQQPPYQQNPYQQNPYQQPPYQQNPYQQNSYQQQYAPPKQSNGMALASMIFGILALVSCCCSPLVQFPLAVTAIVLMILSRKGRPLSGFAIAGLVMGIIAVLMSIFMTLMIGLLNSPEYRKILNSPEYQKIYEDIYESLYESENE